MKKYKAILLDVDGVIAVPQRQFLNRYNELFPGRNVVEKDVDGFFLGDFQKTLTGEADLKDILKNHTHRWQWDGTIQELLDIWFEADSGVNQPALKLIAQLREKGVKCYAATNNEHYRAQYMMQHMFKDQLDGIFASGDMGVKKPDTAYFEYALKELSLPPEQVLFADDFEENVDAANELGIDGRYVDHETIVEVLQEVLNAV
jgi:putative hydrolase of the HAD superfamily